MLDGLFVAALRQELDDRLRTGRIASVQVVDRFTLVLEVRRQRLVEPLLLSCDPELPRVHLLSHAPPMSKRSDTPPAFALLLRRYLEGARVQAVSQPGPGYERLLRFELDTRGAGGLSYPLWLIAELFGKKADLWLVEANTQQILDGWRQQRGLAAGLTYLPPPRQDKVVLQPGCGERVGERWRWLAATHQGGQQQASAALAAILDGVGPLTAAEIVARAQIVATTPADHVLPEQLQQLSSVVEQVSQAAAAGRFTPTVLGPAVLPTDLCALALTSYPLAQRQEFPSASLAMEQWATPRWEQATLAAHRRDLMHPVQAALRQAERRLDKQEQELVGAEKADQWRLFGELLLSHLAEVPPGATQVELENYYAQPPTPVRIPLDPARSPAENAQRYFHRYARARRTQEAAAQQVKRTRREVHYLQGVLAELDWAASFAELAEIERELEQSGLRQVHSARPHAAAKAAGPRTDPLPPRRFVTADQIEVWVGRNNRQNDRLSLKQAAPADLWFHAHQIPGAHVILRSGHLNQVPDSSLVAAAQLAAYYSRGASATYVPVDYTLCKNLRKPKGSAPGYVIYHTYKTVQVKPSLATVEPLRTAEPGPADCSRPVESRP